MQFQAAKNREEAEKKAAAETAALEEQQRELEACAGQTRNRQLRYIVALEVLILSSVVDIRNRTLQTLS